MERTAQAPDVWESPDPPLAFAQDQLAWYSRNNRNARIGHYSIEVSQLVAAAATTLAAAIGATAALTAALASLTLLLTGLRQVFAFREKWATMTWATVQIEHEITLYRLQPPEGRAAAGRRLVLQVDSIVAEETQGWAERLRA
ncbi:MAG TPA: DUF4231 domain-containing protein, partial [Ornithinibacter sp.]|nr:DUF4231 domain-containing protein [Ornithinibacter sp.]